MSGRSVATPVASTPGAEPPRTEPPGAEPVEPPGLPRAALLLLIPAWVLLDLWLGRDLPLAPRLQHWAFRAVVGPLEWLTEGSGSRLRAGGAAWLALTVLALPLRRRLALVWAANAAGLAGGMAFVAVLGLLMERGLGAGIAATVALRLALRGRYPLIDESRRAVIGAASAAVGLLSVYYLYSTFMTRGGGYPLLQALGDALRGSSVSYLAIYGVVVGLGVALGLALAPRRGALLLAASVGLVAALGSRWLLHTGGPLWPAPLVLLAAAALAEPLLPGSAPSRRPRTWPRTLLLPALCGLLLVGHAYAGRVLACPPDGALPGLAKLAEPGETFRIAPGRGGLALSLRQDRRIGFLVPGAGGVRFADPGPLAAPGPHDGSLDGTPEELVYAPSRDRWFATVVPADPWAFMPRGAPPEQEIHNVIATIGPQARRILDARGVPGLCWINTLQWSDDEGLLYAGCEDVPGLHRLDPATMRVTGGTAPRALGDVQDLALDPATETLWTISLWFRPRLTELDRRTLAIRRQGFIGGTHYHLARDPQTRRLFATSWYGSRLRVVDGDSLRVIGTLPLGLGGRAVEVDAQRRLALVSSTYDGLLRLCDTDTLRVRAALPVGGHVKAIALDDGHAWFWSQCGLFELDIDAALAALDQR